MKSNDWSSIRKLLILTKCWSCKLGYWFFTQNIFLWKIVTAVQPILNLLSLSSIVRKIRLLITKTANLTMNLITADEGKERAGALSKGATEDDVSKNYPLQG